MSAEASPTAAAAPQERREQPPAALAIANASMANAVRALAMDAVEQAKSGHPGMPMGMADVATVLFSRFLKFDPADPAWADRDRFVLSAGHGSMLIYALLHLTGYEGMTLDQIRKFRQLGSITAGHPEYGHAPGIETTTGPLGQGLANAVGMAIAERHLAAEFGDSVVDHKTYVIASDGDLMEGISHEAIALAGHLKLNKLIVLFDDNGISIDGALSLSDSVDQVKRFEAAGWNAARIDGHDAAAISAALEKAQTSDKPVLIACKSKIGFGAPTKQGSEKSHGSPLGAEEIAGARKNLGWTSAPFDVPADVLKAWRAIGARSKSTHADWKKRLTGLESGKRAEFERRMKGDLPKQALADAVRAVKEKLAAQPKEIATRTACELALESLIPALPEMIGGSADLTGSNNTRIKDMKAISAADFSGRFIHYGVREHGMAAAMNGMALHGGIVPYSGTFLVFSDYCRPAIRLAALMGKRVIHVASAKTDRRISRSNISPRCAQFRTCWCSVLATRWKRRSAGSWRSSRQTGRAYSRLRARTCRSCAIASTRTISARSALMNSRALTAVRMFQSSPRAPKFRSRSTAQSCLRSMASRPGWFQCRVSNCSWNRTSDIAAPSLGVPA